MPSLRNAGWRLAPGVMAERARQHERRYRDSFGMTRAAEQVVGASSPVVRAGPFAGLAYPREALPDTDAAAAKMLGTYEQEIAAVFADAIERGVRTFVDVGCADGYYAVGMPLVAAGVTTYAFDIAVSARRLCETVAALNGVAERVHVGRRATARALARLPMTDALVLCDIEGAEATLFDDAFVTLLADATVVIEVHEHLAPGVGQQLADRFSASHAVARIDLAARDPQAGVTDLALVENRPEGMHWLVCTPHVH